MMNLPDGRLGSIAPSFHWRLTRVPLRVRYRFKMIVLVLTWTGIACWMVCFWWMHRISQRQDIVLKELQQQAHSIEELSREEREILKELHPTVQKIDENVDKVKESTEA